MKFNKKVIASLIAGLAVGGVGGHYVAPSEVEVETIVNKTVEVPVVEYIEVEKLVEVEVIKNVTVEVLVDNQNLDEVLEHLYDNLQVWHQEGGWSGILEEELVLARPAHDDVKDALASAVEIAVSPAKSTGSQIKEFFNQHKTNSRFGGMSY